MITPNSSVVNSASSPSSKPIKTVLFAKGTGIRYSVPFITVYVSVVKARGKKAKSLMTNARG